MKQKMKDEVSNELIDGAALISVNNDNSLFANLADCLVEINKHNTVVGFILRNNTSAIVDLEEEDKIFEYAVLSSQIDESSRLMARQFNLSDIESVLIEGKSLKVLCMSMNENRISIFIEKTAPHSWIIERLLQ